jgi:capsular exopolysaccharide synthesis family protein
MTVESKGTLAPTTAELSVAGVVSILKAVRKHWSTVVAFVVLGGGISLVYSKSIRKVYEAASLVEINPRASQPLGDEGGGKGALDLGTLFWDSTQYYQTQYKIIGSMPVVRAAAEAVSLPGDYSYFGWTAPPPTPTPLDTAAAVLQHHVSVEAVKQSSLVYIKVDDTDPKRAKRLADAVANAYVEQNLQTAVNASSEAVVWLEGQIDHLRGELEHDENQLNDFKERNNLPSLSINDGSNMLRFEMQEFDGALTHTRTRKAELVARKAELDKIGSEDPDSVPASEMLPNLILKTLSDVYHKAQEEHGALLALGKGEKHPLVMEANDRLQKAKKALLDEIGNIKEGVGHDLAMVEKEEEGETALFNEARRKAIELNMKEIEYHRIDRSRQENEKLYGLLVARMKETDLARMMRANNLRIVEAANLPVVPVRPRIGVNLAIGIIIGFVIGFCTAWLREQLDSSVKTPNDIEQRLGIPFLGLLPEFQEGEPRRGRRGRRRRRQQPLVQDGDSGAPELLVHRRPASGVSEAARTVRTNLMFMNPDKPYRTILVSSAAPSEGKTTVACSIAIAFAQGGQRVCLVDCDLRRPRLHRIFGRQGEDGITNVLVGEATVEQVAKPTGIPNLWSVPAGALPPNPADLLQSQRFRNLIQELGERFDRVVIDSPPLVAVTDSAIISTLVDAVVFVVRAFKTGKYLSAQGLRALRDVEAPLVGAVLNAVNLDHHEYSYYYYYYYKRDGYYRQHSPPDRGGPGPEQPSAPAAPTH